ncbi:hypothetical protein [Streptomyces cylindrosporus]|uniref:Secreted protein n=1 Tax=Streptomyces cylindrosporus TaxID=2927583 RepID=A0ABS9YPK8_9ACTN|nr:hypothetical protein [Streptomyces cylindrosporus]MCI3277771.1 hypothetical protein [Streptomyces cylindrosporus]
MAVNRRRQRRIATLATTVAAVALTAGLVTGCDPDDVDNSLDCVRNYDDIADSLKAIHEAGWDAAKDPSQTDESIDTIEKNLDKIKAENDDSDGDSKVEKAVDDLNQAISDYNKAVLDGEKPDSSKIDKAADELKNVCS